MTKEEFLLDTLEYYTTDVTRRCKSGKNCQYNPKVTKQTNTDGCAIGRHLSEEAKFKYGDRNLSINEMFSMPSIKEMAPQWMQDMDINFLTIVQRLHDSSLKWNEHGLTDYGKRSLASTIEAYELDKEKFTKYLQ